MLETQQSVAPFGSHASDTGETSTVRLVIRARILPGDPPSPVQHTRSMNRRAIALVSIAVLALVAIAIGIAKHQSTRTSKRPSVAVQPAPPPPAPIAQEEATPVAAEPLPDPNTAINEVMPAVSRASLQTIRGTIKVVIRVLVNDDGTVRAATTHLPGPSRYFERVALQSAKKWTFAPTSAKEPRTFLVHFDFTRGGVTGGADLLDKTH